MGRRLWILLLASFALALVATDNADAENVYEEWHYLTEGNTVTAISADGNYIVAGSDSSYNSRVYLFDKGSFIPLWSHTLNERILSVDISAYGEHIVAGTQDSIYLFNRDSSTPIWEYTPEWGPEVYAVAISDDGEYIAAGTQDDKVYFFHTGSSTPLWEAVTGEDVQSVAISADGEYIAAGSDNNRVYLYHKDSSTPLWYYQTGNDVRTVSISATGQYITVGSYDGKVYLFHRSSETVLWSYATGYQFYSVVISANGEYIAAINYNKVYLFNKDSETPLWSNYESGGSSVAISENGGQIATGSSNNVQLFTKDDYRPVGSYPTMGSSVAISADGGYIVTGSTAGSVTLLGNNMPPTAHIDGIVPETALADEAIAFSGSGTDSDGTIVAYEWTSSMEGELSTNSNFIITSLGVGAHTISLKVQDNKGEWSTVVSQVITVSSLPLAMAGNDVTTTPNTPVQFNGAGTYGSGTIINYEWDFDGDGIYAWSGPDGATSYIYNNEGTYTAVLRITTNDWFTATDSRIITVSHTGDSGGGDDGDSGLPALSLAATIAAVAIIALSRRR